MYRIPSNYSYGSHQDWKTGKTRRHFPVREKSGNFAKSGKVGEFYTKYWRNQKKILQIGKLKKKKKKKKKYWKSQGNLPGSKSEKPANVVSYFKFKKTLKSQRNLSV